MKTKMLYSLQSTFGIAVSALCATAVALVFSKTHWKLVAPFLFAAVLVLLSRHFGALVSVVGSLILLSISASYLLFPSRTDRPNL
jgi:hypothetical protein